MYHACEMFQWKKSIYGEKWKKWCKIWHIHKTHEHRTTFFKVFLSLKQGYNKVFQNISSTSVLTKSFIQCGGIGLFLNWRWWIRICYRGMKTKNIIKIMLSINEWFEHQEETNALRYCFYITPVTQRLICRK